MTGNKEYIEALTLDESSIIRRTPEVEHERDIAIADLLEENQFAPAGLNCGPYRVMLSVAENRLGMHISAENLTKPTSIVLALTPFRRIIRDYFLICESYYDAIKHASSSKIEAIDMGRRGVHNEGSEQLKDLLKDRITIDFETSRRLFTLICVLHIK